MSKPGRYVFWGLLFIAIAGIALVFWCKRHHGVAVCITNSSYQELKAAEIIVEGDGTTTHLEIPSFLPQQVRCVSLPAPSSGGAVFSFEDSAGNIYGEGVVGYFERGYYGRSSVIVGPDFKIATDEEISPDCLSRALKLF